MLAEGPQRTRVVMIGGGYAGIRAFRSLRARLRGAHATSAVDVTVISPKTYHEFHGWTAEALAGIVSIDHRSSPLREVFEGERVIAGAATHVDLERQVVTGRLTGTDQAFAVPYDHLLFGIGSHDFVESVPGLERHGWWLKEAGGLLATRNQLIRVLDRADALHDPEARQRLLTVVIAGGGFAGVEIAAAVAEWLQVWRRYYPVLREVRPRVVLVHSGVALLGQLRPRYSRLADYATRQLRQYGVEIRLQERLAEVRPDGAVLADGAFIPSETVISTLGQTLMRLPGAECLPCTDAGRLITDRYLRVQGRTNVWAAGDCASVAHVRSGKPTPANALWGIQHGNWAGENIGRTILGQPLRPFTYRGLGQAASLGIGKGASELYGLQFTGWIGWWMRFFFFLYFMPSRRQMIRILLDWATLPLLGRRMNVLDARDEAPSRVPVAPGAASAA